MKNSMSKIKRLLILILLVMLLGVLFLFSLPTIPKPERIEYGVSFSKYHSDELGLDWRQTYEAVLTDLRVKNIRLSAHWPMIESTDDQFDFEALDYQVQRAKEENAEVILSVGRRLPGWPECHVPLWAQGLTESEEEDEILEYVEAVVKRYKNEKHIAYWQVENEIFLWHFASEICPDLDKYFFDKEIELVKKLDPDTPIIITDSGEFGSWIRAHKRGDAFGTTMYLYIWSPRLGALRYPICPGFFFFKQNIVSLFDRDKPRMLVELGLEPWLLEPIVQTPLDVQLQRMGLDKFRETIKFARETRFDKQYLWGVEWWYWMKVMHGDDRFWEEARLLFD